MRLSWRFVRTLVLSLVLCVGKGGGLLAQDTLWVAADNPPVWGERTALREELRIGSLSGEVYETFGGVAGVAVTDGVIHVADWQVPAIRQFDSEGAYLGDLGREGEGPGEYLRLNAIGTLPGDRVVVQDARRRRAIVYGVDGSVVREFLLHSGLNSVFPTFKTDQFGHVYVKATDRDAVGGFTGPLVDPPYLWIKYDSIGQLVDSIRVGRSDPEGPSFTLTGSGGPRFPFTIENEHAVSPAGYLVWGRTDRYAFLRRLPDGRVVGVTRTAERLELTAAERRQWEARSAYIAQRPNVDDFPPIPNDKPYFRALYADVEGRVWMEKYVAPYERPYTQDEIEAAGDRPLSVWRELQVFDVFEPEGRFLGTVTMPQDTRLAFARGDRVWGIETGAYDEAYVVQFVINGVPAGG